MMETNIVSIFNDKRPAVICTAGSNISAANEAARESILRHSEGESLFDHMEAEDALKYTAMFYSDRCGEYLAFPVYDLHGYTYAVAVFDLIMGRRFSLVSFFGREEKNIKRMYSSLKSAGSCFPERAQSFVKAFAAIDDGAFECEDRVTPGELYDITRALCERTGEDSRFPALKLNSRLCTVLVGAPQIAVVELFCLIAAALREMGAKSAFAEVSSLGGIPQMRLWAEGVSPFADCSDLDALIDAGVAGSVQLVIADYIAGLYGANISAASSVERGEVSLTVEFESRSTELLDFKSRQRLAFFEEDLGIIMGHLEKLWAKGRAEAQE